MPASTMPRDFRQHCGVHAKSSGQPSEPAALPHGIPVTTSDYAMKHDIQDTMDAQILSAFRSSVAERPDLADYINGIGMAFDPFPLAYIPTFIDNDIVAFALDMGFVNGDYQCAIPSIKAMERVASPTLAHPVKTIYGKAGRLSEKT